MQTLTSGMSLVDQLKFIGFRQNIVSDPAQCFMVLAGKQGCGKSQLMQGCPDALILNLDNQPTSHPKVAANIVPGRRRDGIPVMPNPAHPTDLEKGTPTVINWEFCLSVRDMLVEASAQGLQGRPKMVVIDTADTACRLVEEWLVEQHNIRSPNNQKDMFNDLDGRQAYPRLRRELLGFALDLRQAGYGVCFIMHLMDKLETINDSGSKKLLIDYPRINQNTWNGITAEAEIVGKVARNIRKLPSRENGKVGWTIERTHTLSFIDAEQNIETKGREGIPDSIILHPETGWQDFVNAFSNKESA